jgi:hypothetical protein
MEDRLFALQQFQAAHDRSGTAHHSQTEARRRSVLDDGQRTPILVRTGGARFGLHCLEAVKALGEKISSASLSPRTNTKWTAPSFVPAPALQAG